MTVRSVDPKPRPAHPPVAIARQPLGATAARRWTRVVDVIAMVAAAVLLFSVATDAAGLVRVISALMVALVVPGWTLCRWCGWGFAAATLLTAITTSVAIVIILGQVTITRTDWKLESVAVVLSAVCLAALGLVQLTRRADV
jgi:hypothetical protein